jgi:hypothetical protein
MQPTQIKAPVKCPKCGGAVVPCHTDLDERLEHDEAIPMVCFWCEHKWEVDAQEKARVRNQRKELRNIAAR